MSPREVFSYLAAIYAWFFMYALQIPGTSQVLVIGRSLTFAGLILNVCFALKQKD